MRGRDQAAAVWPMKPCFLSILIAVKAFKELTDLYLRWPAHLVVSSMIQGARQVMTVRWDQWLHGPHLIPLLRRSPVVPDGVS